MILVSLVTCVPMHMRGYGVFNLGHAQFSSLEFVIIVAYQRLVHLEGRERWRGRGGEREREREREGEGEREREREGERERERERVKGIHTHVG